MPPDLPRLHANRGDGTVTSIGHATVPWQIGGLNLLTDPHFGERASPVPFAMDIGADNRIRVGGSAGGLASVVLAQSTADRSERIPVRCTPTPAP